MACQRQPLRGGIKIYHASMNCGRRSLVLDLQTDDGKCPAREPALKADAEAEGCRSGVMQRLGLDCESLFADNGIFIAEVMRASCPLSAGQTAPVQRRRRGLGRRIEVAPTDCMLNLQIHELQVAQFPFATPSPACGPVSASDSDLMIASIATRSLGALSEVTGLVPSLGHPRFAPPPSRNASWQAMMPVVEEQTLTHAVADCLRALDAAACLAPAMPSRATP